MYCMVLEDQKLQWIITAVRVSCWCPPISAQVQLINDAYNLLIDAMLGPEADCSNIKEPYSGILVTLKQVNIPIVSVDVPSGKRSHWLEAERHPRNHVEEKPQARASATNTLPTVLHPVLTPHVLCPVFYRLGRRRAEPVRNQPRCSYLAHGS